MPYRTMSLEEFARHINMDAREVRRLAERDKLPGQKIGGEWRFNRARVTEWLQAEMPSLDENRLLEIEKGMGGAETTNDEGLVVTDLIGLDGVDPSLPARTRASVLRELVRLAERTGVLYDAEGLHQAITERESISSTALPNGIAIPHPRQPMPYVSSEPFICLARVPGGIAFGAPGGALTHVFFLICCHDDRYHLRVLARLMRVLDEETVDVLRSLETREEFLEKLIVRERLIAARMGKAPSRT